MHAPFGHVVKVVIPKPVKGIVEILASMNQMPDHHIDICTITNISLPKCLVKPVWVFGFKQRFNLFSVLLQENLEGTVSRIG